MLVPNLERAVVEEQLAPAFACELVVLAAFGAHLEVRGERFGGQRLAAAVALAKYPFAEALLFARVGRRRFALRPHHGTGFIASLHDAQ